MAIKERCKNFKEWEVLAIQDDRKTQFREIVKTCNHPTIFHYAPNDRYPYYFRRKDAVWDSFKTMDELTVKYCPYGKIGDRVWGRETFYNDAVFGSPIWHYKADGSFDEQFERHRIGHVGPFKWKPSTQMPRNASRILLEVTDVRVEILGEITEEDAIGEGVELIKRDNLCDLFENYSYGANAYYLGSIPSFVSLQNYLYGKDYWETNKDKWVWVITFKRLK